MPFWQPPSSRSRAMLVRPGHDLLLAQRRAVGRVPHPEAAFQQSRQRVAPGQSALSDQQGGAALPPALSGLAVHGAGTLARPVARLVAVGDCPRGNLVLRQVRWAGGTPVASLPDQQLAERVPARQAAEPSAEALVDVVPLLI